VVSRRAISQLGLSVALIEKDKTVLSGLSRRSSGIIWPGGKNDLERNLTVLGCKKMENFKRKLRIPHKTTGFMVVGLGAQDLPHLQNYHKWCQANNIPSSEVNVKDVEPYVISGINSVLTVLLQVIFNG
jgi:L-2-hydroxyglutarate oxidase LhgO